MQLRAEPASNLADIVDSGVPDARPALVFTEDGGRATCTLSYGCVRRQIRSIAGGLTARGLMAGDRVAILADNRPEHLLALLGIVRAGMVAVPVNQKLLRDGVRQVIDHADTSLTLCDSRNEGMLADRHVRLSFDDDRAFAAVRDGAARDVPATGPEDVAAIMHTSGSTGTPKGVPITHGGYGWAIRSFEFLRPSIEDKAVLIAAPLFHMNAQFHALLTLRCGGTAVLLKRFVADAYLTAIESYSASRVTGVPTMFVLLLRALGERPGVDTASVESVALGSAPVGGQLVGDLARAFPGAAISNGYGTTEAGPAIFGPHPEGLPTPPLSLGVPMPGVDVRLVGTQADDRGELWVRNPMVSAGYIGRPAAAESGFRDGWYATGDVMRRDRDGFHYFLGRNDDMLVCGGENVFPMDVESRLERHPEIVQAVVVAIPDEVKGDIPVAFVIAVPGSSLDAEDVRQFALRNGPAYAHPRHVAFVHEMPLSAANKTDRAALQREAVELFGGLRERRAGEGTSR